MNRLKKVPFVADIRTDGQGWWSEHVAQVRVTHLQVPYINDELDHGELCVYFDTSTWNIEQHGLIYTDDQWLRELRVALQDAGYDAGEVCYSEQGMQGDNYVSLDVERHFLASWLAAHTVAA